MNISIVVEHLDQRFTINMMAEVVPRMKMEMMMANVSLTEMMILIFNKFQNQSN